MKTYSASLRGQSIRFAAIKKKSAEKEFRALRGARRLTQPSLCELLKKLDQNFHITDEISSQSNFSVSPLWVVVPKRLREQLFG